MQTGITFHRYTRIIQQQGQFILSGISICTGIIYIATLSCPSTTEISLGDHYYLDSKTVLIVMISASSLTALILLLARWANTRAQPGTSDSGSSFSTSGPPFPQEEHEPPHALPVPSMLLAPASSREEECFRSEPPVQCQWCACISHEPVQNREQLT